MSKALQTEIVVLYDFLSKKYQLLYYRKKIFGIEVDLIFTKEDRVVLVEVKTLSQTWSLPYRISKRQRERLKTAREFLQNIYQVEVELIYAFLDREELILLNE